MDILPPDWLAPEPNIPDGTQSVDLSTPQPITLRAPVTMLLIHPRGGGLYRRPIATRPFERFAGFLFSVTGYVSTEPIDQTRAQPWELAPKTWQGTAFPGLTVGVVRMAASWPDATLRAVRRWHPNQSIFDTVEHVQGGATPNDYRKAANALEAIVTFTEHLRTATRPRDSGEYNDASEEAFFNELGKAAHEAVKEGESVTYASLGRHGAHSWRTYKKYVERWHYDLKAIEDEARRHKPGRRDICRFHVRRAAEFKKKQA